MSYLNLGIVAHVDAGKTSLTERLLVEAGVRDHAGRVDAGTTATDTLELERERGITIRAAVVSFDVGDLTVNLVDTPGHPDFIAEVERTLAVLDGAILVVSAVEGVQAQTLVLMRALQRLRIPTLVFVNKVDRRGADAAAVVAEIDRRLTRDAVVMADVTAHEGDARAVVRPRASEGGDFAAFVAAESRRGAAHPVYVGSALTGAGVPQLVAALRTHLPASSADGDGDGAPSGVVFKIERDPGRRRVAYVRMRSGALRVRDRLDLGHGKRERLTGIRVFAGGTTHPADGVGAGRVALLRGLDTARVGDVVGEHTRADGAAAGFPPPSFETVVDVDDAADRGRLWAALAELADQDPLIGARRDPATDEIAVSLYGQVQREVLAATLARDYGVQARFDPTTTAHVERVVRPGHAVEFNKVAPNEFLATVGLRVEPAPPGAGVTFRLEVELGAMPPAFFAAVEETVRGSLARGPHGWPVPDVAVVMTHSGYSPRQSHMHQKFNKAMSSTGADFRGLTPRVLATALQRAGTVVCEPVHRVVLEVPEDATGPVTGAVAALGGTPEGTSVERGLAVLTGSLPARSVQELRARLSGLTRGEGFLRSEPDRFAPVRGEPPVRRP